MNIDEHIRRILKVISKIFSFLLLTLLIINKGHSMSISDIGRVCTFSSIKAKVTLNGQPAIGAKVTRLTDWKKPLEDTTVTDQNGYFEFPALYERSIGQKVLPIQFAVSQVVTIDYQGNSYEIWVTTKMSTEENSELDGISLDLTCELSNEMKTYRVSGPILGTICTWNK